MARVPASEAARKRLKPSTHNHLLAALPAEYYAYLLPNLGQIPMPLGQAVYEAGAQVRPLYFPCIVSLLNVPLRAPLHRHVRLT